MNKYMIERILKEANHIISTNDTVRDIAATFGVSKSTVHKDLHERLLSINPQLHESIRKIFKEHIDIRHIRGGESTRKKYLFK